MSSNYYSHQLLFAKFSFYIHSFNHVILDYTSDFGENITSSKYLLIIVTCIYAYAYAYAYLYAYLYAYVYLYLYAYEY